jgi:3-hydroxyisobutyrate dehydrogenase-like beta-hydroxyacid dehydrogenase
MSGLPSIGFVGFGEAGFTIAQGLRSAGVERISAYDIATDSADRGPQIRDRAAESQVTLVASSSALAAASEVLFSTVTSSDALTAARQTAPFLTSAHVYADLNSVSPALKREVREVVAATGAGFVEAAVMAPVQPYGHRVPMLLGGDAVERFMTALTPLGMRLTDLHADVGTAAAVKMCRSIVVKGLEALLAECVLAAVPYEADAHVFASLNESFPGIDWKKLADYTIGRVVVHGERRAREMEEVAETLRAIGVDPIMAEATARRQDWSALLDLRSRFGPEGPRTYAEVVGAIKGIGHRVTRRREASSGQAEAPPYAKAMEGRPSTKP